MNVTVNRPNACIRKTSELYPGDLFCFADEAFLVTNQNNKNVTAVSLSSDQICEFDRSLEVYLVCDAELVIRL